MVPVRVPLSVPPPVALLKVMVVVLVGLLGLPKGSSDSTVTLKAVPGVPVLGTEVYTSFVAAAALTIIEELAALVVSASPLARDAVRVIVSAFVYWTAASVAELVAALMVAVLPLNVPVPEAASEIPVLAATAAGLPNVSCD
jgi:hypothetical protein